MELLFPFAEYWWFYGLFTLLVLALLALDLGVFHRTPHRVSFREAATWSVIWVTIALIFNAALYAYSVSKFGEEIGTRVGLEFLTGFVIEKALAIDNIFVFVVIFSFFAVPPEYQHRILFFGVIGALVFRAIFIALGAALLQYELVVILFGAFLILTGIKIFFAPDEPADLSRSRVLKFARRVLPVTDRIDGPRFFTRVDGRLLATPLFMALVLVEFSDIVFAVDSVPAIFAITREPFIVLTSNVFAILGLRSLFFLLAGCVDKFHYLKFGLGTVLVFVGLKMVWLNNAFGGKFPISWSLAIVSLCIGGSILASLMFPRFKRGEFTEMGETPPAGGTGPA